MTAALVRLNPAAQVALTAAEQRIERGLKTFIDVGQALAEIRDSRLYRGTHDTFETYLEERWQMSRSYAHRMIAAAEVVLPMGNIGVEPPRTERQVRELAKVPEAERAEVWTDAVERTGGRPTAAAVRQVAEERVAPKSPEPVASPTAPVAGSGTTAEPPPAAETDSQRELREELARDSERRAAAAGIRSVLTYMTSRVLDPAALARQYVLALDEFTAEDLRFAAETLVALAALKEQ